MGKFQDFDTALRFRQVVTEIAEGVVDRMRPTYKYATVTAIDMVNRKVTVRFPGETSTVTIAAGSIMPSAVGQRVRVAGVGGERYLADVMGRAAGDLPMEQGAIWSNVTQEIPSGSADYAILFGQGASGPFSPASWVNGSFADRITVPAGSRSGWYQFTTILPLTMTGNAIWHASLRLVSTGAIIGMTRGRTNPNSNLEIIQVMSRPVQCVAGDSVRAIVSADVAGCQMNGGYYVNPFLHGWRMGDA